MAKRTKRKWSACARANNNRKYSISWWSRMERRAHCAMPNAQATKPPTYLSFSLFKEKRKIINFFLLLGAYAFGNARTDGQSERYLTRPFSWLKVKQNSDEWSSFCLVFPSFLHTFAQVWSDVTNKWNRSESQLATLRFQYKPNNGQSNFICESHHNLSLENILLQFLDVNKLALSRAHTQTHA